MVNWDELRAGKSVFEQMTAGYAYKPDAECADIHYRAVSLVEEYTALYRTRDQRRLEVLGQLLGSLGQGSIIRPSVSFDYGVNTHIGSDCFFNFGCVFLDVAPIVFGNKVLVGPNVQFLTPTHPLNPVDRENLWEGGLPIQVGNNVWIGGGAIICPGVSIGDHAVIGAGSVVTRDLPAYSLAVGNPARVIRTLSDQERPSDPADQFSPEALGLA